MLTTLRGALVNTTRRRLGLCPDRTESYPLLVIRKPAPTVAGDRRGDAEGASWVASPTSARASFRAPTRTETRAAAGLGDGSQMPLPFPQRHLLR